MYYDYNYYNRRGRYMYNNYDDQNITGEGERCFGNLRITERCLWLLGDHLYSLSGDYHRDYNDYNHDDDWDYYDNREI